MPTKLLMEHVDARPTRVDTEQGILHDCLLLGPTSKNAVSYPDSTREKAIPLFEGAMVNLSHPQVPTHLERERIKALAAPVDWNRRYGKASNVRNTPDGLRGDVRVLRKHPFTETLMEAASSMPELFGFSPLMLGLMAPQRDSEGREICLEIKKLRSIDIVTDPGTTRSLFEEWDMAQEVEKELQEDHLEPQAEKVEEDFDEIGVLMHAVLNEIDDFEDHKDPEKAKTRIGKHLKHHHKMHMQGEGEGEEGEEEEKEEQSIWDWSTPRIDKGPKKEKVLKEENQPAKPPVQKPKSGYSGFPTAPSQDQDWNQFLRAK